LSRRYRPIDATALSGWLAEQILAQPAGTASLRVAIDGAPAAQPDLLANAVLEPLRAGSREPVLVAADTFWRDASLRLEYGHEDVDSYLTWLDADALRREVLEPVGPGGSGRYLPSLRDPVTNRATRQLPRTATPATVVIVHGSLLLGLGLPFDLTIHLELSPAARVRRTAPGDAWTLPAFDRYDAALAEGETAASIVIKLDDPRHPAIATAGPAARE
jgi:hypothetical protein